MPLPAPTTPAPTVSVITATYNRSRALRLAVQSVLGQTLPNWRLHVIGDACTDDTAQVLQAFRDPRIEFENLAQNVGEQSGPNNVGLQKARGRYLAFLNHDDLWLPDHLATAVRALEETGADLVLMQGEVIRQDGVNRFFGRSDGRFDLQCSYPASTWVFRRELAQELGPWRRGRDILGSPSQQWLFRAWRAKRQIIVVPHLTVVHIPSTSVPDGYTQNGAALGEIYLARINSEPDFRAREIVSALRIRATDRAQGVRLRHRLLRWNSLRGALATAREACWTGAIHLARRCAPWFHLHPEAAESALRHPGRGGLINHLRKLRGLRALGASTPRTTDPVESV